MRYDLRSATIVRWVGRAIGGLTLGFWLFMAVGEALSGNEPWVWESYFIVVFLAALLVSYGLAWWRENVGGTALLFVSIAFGGFALITSGHNHFFAMLISGGPFFLAAVFLLASWWQRHTNSLEK